MHEEKDFNEEHKRGIVTTSECARMIQKGLKRGFGGTLLILLQRRTMLRNRHRHPVRESESRDLDSIRI